MEVKITVEQDVSRESLTRFFNNFASLTHMAVEIQFNEKGGEAVFKNSKHSKAPLNYMADAEQAFRDAGLGVDHSGDYDYKDKVLERKPVGYRLEVLKTLIPDPL